MATFRSIIRALGPRWLTDGDGELVLHAVGTLADAFAERAKLGLLARFPSTSPSDALPLIGADRRIVRGISEGAESFAERLRGWLTSWRSAGSALSVLRQLRGYMLGATPTLRIVDNTGNWTTLSTSDVASWALRGAWNWDGLSARWWRFWTIIDSSSGPFTAGPNIGDPSLWGGAIGTPGYTIGTTATPEQIASIRAIVNTWAAAHAVSRWIIISLDGAHFTPGDPAPDGTWGPWSKNVGGAQTATRYSGARYVDGA